MAEYDLKPIETTFKGKRYRSRLEARWAVFLDALGETFAYEMEGFELQPIPQTDTNNHPSRVWCDMTLFYVPDFWLPRSKQWIEIKPDNGIWGFDDMTIEKAYRLLVQDPMCSQVVIVCGLPGLEDTYSAFGHGGFDDNYFWCECPDCGIVGLQYAGRSDRLPCKESYDGNTPGCKRHGANRDKGYNWDTPRLRQAFEVASNHRFDWR